MQGILNFGFSATKEGKYAEKDVYESGSSRMYTFSITGLDFEPNYLYAISSRTASDQHDITINRINDTGSIYAEKGSNTASGSFIPSETVTYQNGTLTVTLPSSGNVYLYQGIRYGFKLIQ